MIKARPQCGRLTYFVIIFWLHSIREGNDGVGLMWCVRRRCAWGRVAVARAGGGAGGQWHAGLQRGYARPTAPQLLTAREFTGPTEIRKDISALLFCEYLHFKIVSVNVIFLWSTAKKYVGLHILINLIRYGENGLYL